MSIEVKPGHWRMRGGKIATVGDALWTPDKQRCWDLMEQFAGGVHHMGQVYHWGNGLRMSWLGELATFDGDDLTRLVVLAHRHLCRCSVSSGGPRRVAIEVFARKPEGSLYSRHPGLDDLVSQCQTTRTTSNLLTD